MPARRAVRAHAGRAPRRLVRIEVADKTLQGDAPSSAVRWCGPFVHANAYGFWLYSPVDIDVTWHGGRWFEYEVIDGYTDEDYPFVAGLQSPEDEYRYAPRSKLDPGGVFEGFSPFGPAAPSKRRRAGP
jgi:hypothetical protein